MWQQSRRDAEPAETQVEDPTEQAERSEGAGLGRREACRHVHPERPGADERQRSRPSSTCSRNLRISLARKRR